MFNEARNPYQRIYASHRYPVYAAGGMVNCSSPQAAPAGLDILRRGGNAMDAAIAAAAAISVTEPTSNGIGSDAFALIWSAKDQKLYGLNSSGRSPALISIERVLADGRAKDGKMPMNGWTSVNVPGAPAAWAAVSRRFGRLPLSETVKPAVAYARDGFPLNPVVCGMWKANFENYKKIFSEPCFDAWFETFAPDGRPPVPGEILRFPDHADTIEEIGRTEAESFYRGELAKKIDAESRRYGGYLRADDLAEHEVMWVEPIRMEYRGYEVCEIPPNGHGIIVLMALNILKNFEFREKDCAETQHRQIEALKMAYADAFHYVTDVDHMKIDYHRLLDTEFGAMRAAEMTERAQVWTHRVPLSHGTVYLCAADSEGNMISYIQSNYKGFGSGIVVRGTGISLQNRGIEFSLDPSAANCLAPKKRTYHTIIPGFIMKDGKPVGPFGVMGGYMQPQGHLQVAANFIDFGLNPQQSLDSPRWQWFRDGKIAVEPLYDKNIAGELAARGHEIRQDLPDTQFGRGQMIVRLENGVLVGGTESRTDSLIACY